MNAREILATKKDDESVWVENLLDGRSVYRSERTKDKFEMEPNGFVGSIVSFPVKVAKENYLLRAVSRGKLTILTDEEQSEKQNALRFREEADDHSRDSLIAAMDKGASENSSRYSKKGLPDDAEERSGAMTAKQIWGKPSDKGASTVRRSDIKARVVPSDEVPDGPMDYEMTPPVKEGDWQSDTGL